MLNASFSFMLVTALWLLILVVRVSTVSLGFLDTRDFYHELGREAIMFLLHKMTINKGVIEGLGGLLADEIFDIASIYDAGCELYVSKARIKKILRLVRGNKNLEMRWLGTGCMTSTIIKVRKSMKMWPPTRIPLLTEGLDLSQKSADAITRIFKEAMKRPDLWYSDEWVWTVDWEKLTDLEFWRLIPIDDTFTDDSKVFKYVQASLLATRKHASYKDLEELLMKTMRLLMLSKSSAKILQERAFLCGKEGFLRNFNSFREDQWSEKVLNFLKNLCAVDLKTAAISEALLKSGLLEFNTWERAIKLMVIDREAAINNLFELFTSAIIQSDKAHVKRGIARLLRNFLDSLQDLSYVSPLRVKNFVVAAHSKFNDALTRTLSDKLLVDDRLFPFLCNWLFSSSKGPQVVNCRMKGHMMPLRDEFLRKEASPWFWQARFVKKLYAIWKEDKKNWPGLLIAHQNLSKKIFQRFSKHGELAPWQVCSKERSSYDKETWGLIFSAIRFEIEYDIPRIFWPSMCDLQALLYFLRIQGTELGFDWTRLQKETGKQCIFPRSKSEQGLYLSILGVAHEEFFSTIPSLPWTSARNIQALMRGDAQEGAVIDEF